MNPEWVRERCLSFPSASEHVIWGTDLTFKVAGKIFAHLVLDPAPVWLSFKTTPDNFYELTERPSIIPAPYMARASYIALQTRDALAGEELGALLRESYELVVAKLPKKTRESLASGVSVGASVAHKKARKKTAERLQRKSSARSKPVLKKPATNTRPPNERKTGN
jgi:predicted DNA-binding protein (MmcQ/YjbR family)